VEVLLGARRLARPALRRIAHERRSAVADGDHPAAAQVLLHEHRAQRLGRAGRLALEPIYVRRALAIRSMLRSEPLELERLRLLPERPHGAVRGDLHAADIRPPEPDRLDAAASDEAEAKCAEGSDGVEPHRATSSRSMT
jgi:hypothetical protein